MNAPRNTPDRRGAPLGLGAMIAAGGRAVSEFTGMVLGLFAVQAMLALGSGLVVAQLLASQFATRPMFDAAVDGDLASLIEVLRGEPALMSASQWLSLAAVLLWMVLSWFLVGGALAVLTERPRGRRETARAFGAGGASTFFVFVRLGLASAVLHVALVGPALILGMGAAAPHLRSALTLPPFFAALVLGLLPAALIALFLGTAADYARAELTRQRPSHEGLGAMRALGRAMVFVVRRPLTLGHATVGWLAFFAVSALYAWGSHGHAMLGASGAISLLVLRQVLSLVRMVFKVGVIGGQVELGATRAPPPRQVVDAP
jgi:hypothetical protein